MFEVSFDRIRDVGGDSGFCLKTWERSFLLQVLTERTQLHGLDIPSEATATDIIIQQIKSLWATKELHIENVRVVSILAAARIWYREQGFYSELLHTFIVPSTSRLTLGICLEDLVYEVSPHIDSGGTRALIAALNDGIIMRILPNNTTKTHIECYLEQSHASLRHLARALGEGWISTFDRYQIALPEQLLIRIETPAWPVIHCE